MAIKKGLGRGLDQLLGTGKSGRMDNSIDSLLKRGKSVENISLELLVPGVFQPRRVMSESGLEELSISLKNQGVIQPITVRPLTGGRYEIIAGERRYRAAKMAGLSQIPALVQNISDKDAAIVALVENIQREDLNIMDQAEALAGLVEHSAMTHEEVGQLIGSSRASVSNKIRMLRLDSHVQEMLAAGVLEMGHGRALLGLDTRDQIMVANRVAEKGLSVRETEKIVSGLKKQENGTQKKVPELDPDTKNLVGRLEDVIGSEVKINHRNSGKGSLVINYSSMEKLEEVLTFFLPQS